MAGAKACGRSRNETIWLENQELPAALGQGIRFPLAPEPDFEIEDVAKDMRRFLRRSIREGADFYHRACDFENTAKEMRRYLPRSLREVIVDFSSGACEGKRLIEKVRRLLRRIDKKEALSATAEERDWSRNDGTDEKSFIKAVSGGEIMVIMVRAWTFGGDKATLLNTIFSEISDRIAENPNHNHIVMFAESFFNNLYFGDSKTPLTDAEVDSILRAAETFFGQTRVLISFCFLHHFDGSNVAHKWLRGWKIPSWCPRKNLVNYVETCYNYPEVGRRNDCLLSPSKCNAHIANYNVFWWKGRCIAVYRKAMYIDEVSAEFIQQVGAQRFVYEIGDWTTKLYKTASGDINQFANALFGKDPLIVPRICADISFPFTPNKGRCNVDKCNSQLSHAKLILVSSNGGPYYTDLIKELTSTKAKPFLVMVDSKAEKVSFAVGSPGKIELYETSSDVNYMTYLVNRRPFEREKSPRSVPQGESCSVQ